MQDKLVTSLRVVAGERGIKEVFVDGHAVTEYVDSVHVFGRKDGNTTVAMEMRFDDADLIIEPHIAALYRQTATDDGKRPFIYRLRRAWREAKMELMATRSPTAKNQASQRVVEIAFKQPKHSPQEFADLVEDSFAKKHSND